MESDLQTHEEDRQQELALDKTVNDFCRASRQRADDFLDWAIRRATPNPKFDDEWKIP